MVVRQLGLLRFCGWQGAHKEIWDNIKNRQKMENKTESKETRKERKSGENKESGVGDFALLK